MNVLKFFNQWHILIPYFKTLASCNRIDNSNEQVIHVGFIIILFLGCVDAAIVTAFINLLFISE